MYENWIQVGKHRINMAVVTDVEQLDDGSVVVHFDGRKLPLAGEDAAAIWKELKVRGSGEPLPRIIPRDILKRSGRQTP